jgi:SAM-dependent methyltransferase
MRTILNLGSGKKQRADAVNVDLVASTEPDLVHDLNQFPWPLPDGHFTEVYAMDVIEHLDNVVAVMEEIHRVCADDAIVHITLPHFSSSNAFTDPTHRHYFSIFSFNYFTGGHDFSFYTQKRYRMRRRQMIFAPTLVNKVVWRLANRYPAEYERRWAWLFPAWFLSFDLEVIKSS